MACAVYRVLEIGSSCVGLASRTKGAPLRSGAPITRRARGSIHPLCPADLCRKTAVDQFSRNKCSFCFVTPTTLDRSKVFCANPLWVSFDESQRRRGLDVCGFTPNGRECLYYHTNFSASLSESVPPPTPSSLSSFLSS